MLRDESIQLKTSSDVARIRRAARLVETILALLPRRIEPGVSTAELDAFCEAVILRTGARPTLKGYRGFPASICTSVNEVAAHGVPDASPLHYGDVVTVDITLGLAGWHADAAWSYSVGEPRLEIVRLLRAAWQATLAGIRSARAGARLGDVGHAVQTAAGRHGCTVIDDFAGHGIGRAMHEEPVVLHVGSPGTGRPIVPGMVLTVEPIVTLGARQTRILDDGWSIATIDGRPAAQFEHTIAVFAQRTEVLTATKSGLAVHLDFPPFV
jgi:methionyl aminopeptidase